MIRTLQRKFTVTAMIAVTVLLVLLLGGINLFNAVSVSRESDELMDLLCAREDFGPAPMAPQPGEPRDGVFGRSPDEDDRRSALSFTVRFDGEGTLLGVDLGNLSSLTEAEAEALGRQALESGQTEGRLDARRYRIVTPAPDHRTVVFLDLSRQRHELLRIGAFSALGGLAAWFAMLVLVRFLGKLAIRPVAENVQRQRQFVTDAGHELKTPLAIIQANAEALELTVGESKYSRNIRAQVARLTDLTRNLLTLARFDEDGAALSLTALDLSSLAAEGVESFRAPAEQKGLRLTADIAPDVSVQADREQMKQLLSILLDNAVKYCAPGGEIALTLKREERATLRLSNTVTDQSADPARLFDRFYRPDASRSRETGGYGIGLSAAQAIVRLHKGSLEAAYEGDAIVFTVRLP